MKKTICLNMIVRNENKVIRRCLASVKPIIDYWIIVDTGSSDGTQETIREYLKDIPGELHEYPWVDFAHNRNQALALAKGKGDYLLFIDADEELQFVKKPPEKPPLSKDVYFLQVQQPSGINYYRESFVRTSVASEWKGPVHETIAVPTASTYDVLPGVINFSSTQDGNRSKDPLKYLKDAEVLEQALQKEPNNSRYLFYTAISYGNAGKLKEALYWHEKRIAIEENEQEVFYSLLSIGKIHDNLESPMKTVVNSYTKAFLYRPSRAEPLFFLANYYMRKKMYLLAYVTSKQALLIPMTGDIIFVQHSIYDTELLLQFADSSYLMGRFKETQDAYNKLLKKPNLSTKTRETLLNNQKALQQL